MIMHLTPEELCRIGGDELMDCITNDDGEIMAIPAPNLTAGGVNEMWIRQDWLDALGLEAPRTWDELAQVANAFVTEDPDGNGEDDTIGILGPGNADHMNAVGGNQFGLDPLFSCYQSYPPVLAGRRGRKSRVWFNSAGDKDCTGKYLKTLC